MLVLKFFWSSKKIAFALDDKVSGRFTPLTPFYFFPKENGWEKIKKELKNKLWISNNVSLALLNSLTKVIEFWKMNKDKDISFISSYFDELEDCFLVGFNDK